MGSTATDRANNSLTEIPSLKGCLENGPRRLSVCVCGTISYTRPSLAETRCLFYNGANNTLGTARGVHACTHLGCRGNWWGWPLALNSSRVAPVSVNTLAISRHLRGCCRWWLVRNSRVSNRLGRGLQHSLSSGNCSGSFVLVHTAAHSLQGRCRELCWKPEYGWIRQVQLRLQSNRCTVSKTLVRQNACMSRAPRMSLLAVRFKSRKYISGIPVRLSRILFRRATMA